MTTNGMAVGGMSNRALHCVLALFIIACPVVAYLPAPYVTAGKVVLEDVDANLETFDFDSGKVMRTPRVKGKRLSSLLGDFFYDKYQGGIAIGSIDPLWKNVKDLGTRTIEDVASITPDGFQFTAELVAGHVYCVRTKEMNYGLVQLIRYINGGNQAEFAWKFNYNGGFTFK